MPNSTRRRRRSSRQADTPRRAIGWIVGDEPRVVIDWQGFADYDYDDAKPAGA